jgi:formylglycine-generating enzyme required for sulfatase activity
VTASVWHRPVIVEEVKDRLAQRQARAAVALVRLEEAEEVWPLLRHSPDPRLRGFIINWLNLLGADPRAVAAALDQQGSADRAGNSLRRGSPGTRRIASPPSPTMDAILYHPEISMRRALILALGTCRTDELSLGERVPLIPKLLDFYEHDPDSGIHGAAEWTLRQWGQQAKLDDIDAKLRGKDRAHRRWYVNGQGQTFICIEGPVEFRMGSPPDEPDRGADETSHRRVIPHRLAIAAKEVTVEQFQRFVGENPQFGISRSNLDKLSPDPNGPMIAVSWFGAAAYCNWMSQQEGLPQDQWCYQPNERGVYDKGMTIPADVLQRKGYRLPTEAEWEYACRAGAGTSRYYGFSTELLEKYARYQANSKEHAWRCGSLLPNDLGLFDVLGNAYEWCQEQEPHTSHQPERTGSFRNEIIDDIPRILRGGTYGFQPALVRSAGRQWFVSSQRGGSNGFRLARTYD